MADATPLQNISSIADIASAVVGMGSFAIAVWLLRIANKFRQLEWIRQQNDSWNAYNQLRFSSGTAFDEGEGALFSEKKMASLSTEALGIVHIRMNNMEKEVRGFLSGIIYDGDYEFLVRQILLMRPNMNEIIGFLERESYDTRFRFIVQQVMLADVPDDCEFDDPAIVEIFDRCLREYRSSRRGAFWQRVSRGFVTALPST